MIKNLFFILLLTTTGCAHSQENQEYTKKTGDPQGSGKWYMGREIAPVMGYAGIEWLNRSERDEEENTALLIENMNLKPSDRVADIGAGSGYHAFKMATYLTEGEVYAVDIQEEMLTEIRKRAGRKGVDNIKLIKGSETEVNLPSGKMDKVLMVDVYHEFSFPKEMMASISSALKDDGTIYLIEFRAEDKTVPIKEVHKMSEQQAVQEMEAAGFKLVRNIGNLPWQHCLIFEKIN